MISVCKRPKRASDAFYGYEIIIIMIIIILLLLLLLLLLL